ncbi:flagellar basal-body rod modification protein FlgD [Formivibrio citricus]|uniref:Basal-body rod modification protein FlgD n=1 Tax=Formivibrio citricus TaxID=83765 RepID=A0A1I4ZWB7_9NEIS|nr:flagellar hook assembly protein FlgD [Formivibrio citricus]SFN54330.1 flagellar basal-body rod modification protein FlgD [Formivibrio citricus]
MATTTSSTGSTQQTSFDYTSLNKTTTTSKTDMEDQSDRFMKLLVTQLQNQDPMNPMESAEMTSQMAQINTVTGINKLNTTMTQLMSAYSASQGMQAATVIGHDVMAPGSTMTFDGSTAMDMALNLSATTENIRISIVDKNGNVVEQRTQSSAAAGTVSMNWDGKLADGSMAPAGQYKIVARGTVDGKDVALDTLTWQKAGSVELSSSGVKVVLADGSAVDFAKVTKIR